MPNGQLTGGRLSRRKKRYAAPADCAPGNCLMRSSNSFKRACGRVGIGRTHVVKPETEKSSSAMTTCSGRNPRSVESSFAKLLSTDRGFRPEHVVIAELDFSVSGFTTWVRPMPTRPQARLKELLERIRQFPGAQSAGAAYRFLRRDNRPPVNWPFGIFGRPSVPEGERPTAEHNAISPGYL